MIRLAADEDLNRHILRGVRLRRPDIDFIGVQEAGLAGTMDPAVLEWAVGEHRLLLTHDESTMIDYAYERVRQGLPMLGLWVIRQDLGVGNVIEDVIALAELSREGEWEGQVNYFPL